MEQLEAHVNENKIGLVCIDPIMAFVPGGVDSYRDSDVRRMLHPLSRMAMRTDCVVLIVRHLVKGRSKAITAGGGSIGFIGAARVGYLVGPHPEDEKQRVLTCVKINIGVRPAPLMYRVVSSIETPDAPLIEWSEERPELSAQDLLDGANALDERDARSDAREFLAELLEESPTRGWKWADVIKRGKRDGHNEATLRRVRNQLASRGSTRPSRTALRCAARSGSPAPSTPARRRAPDENRSRTTDQPDVTVTAPDADGSGTGPCDECGRPGVSYGSAMRCLAHSPLMDDDEEDGRWW